MLRADFLIGENHSHTKKFHGRNKLHCLCLQMATPNSCPRPSNPFSSLRPLSLQTLLAELWVFYVYGMPLQPVNLAQLAIILYREEGKHPNCQFAVNNGILGEGSEYMYSFQFIVHQISPNFPFLPLFPGILTFLQRSSPCQTPPVPTIVNSSLS